MSAACVAWLAAPPLVAQPSSEEGVLVLEARGRLGGRATAFADRETGEVVDNGQHVLLGCYRDTWAFLHDIGAEENVRIQPQLAVTMVDRDGRKTRLDCSGMPAPLHLIAGLFDWTALSWSDRWGALGMASAIRAAAAAMGCSVPRGNTR